jgi:hypothetical protein
MNSLPIYQLKTIVQIYVDLLKSYKKDIVLTWSIQSVNTIIQIYKKIEEKGYRFKKSNINETSIYIKKSKR